MGRYSRAGMGVDKGHLRITMLETVCAQHMLIWGNRKFPVVIGGKGTFARSVYKMKMLRVRLRKC